MPRFKLFLEYQGTRYSGWQIQKNARSIQGELQKAIRQVTQEDVFELYGGGRTDAGVHALCQVAHLDLQTGWAPEKLCRATNSLLPKDICLLRVEKAPPRFHARHHAQARSYLYQISRRRSAFGKNLVWWVKEDLDFERMREAGALFPGMKDFRSFAADEEGEKSSRVLIERVEMREAGNLIITRIEGSHFLWKMVRRMIGVMVEVGKGSLAPDDVVSFLKSKSETPARLTAPPSGLFLEGIYYPGDRRPAGLDPVIHIGSPGPGGIPPEAFLRYT
jgi:tRNA pseudouridine38-40 synthase